MQTTLALDELALVVRQYRNKRMRIMRRTAYNLGDWLRKYGELLNVSSLVMPPMYFDMLRHFYYHGGEYHAIVCTLIDKAIVQAPPVLNNDVLHWMMQFLPFDSVLRHRLVCKRFYSLASGRIGALHLKQHANITLFNDLARRLNHVYKVYVAGSTQDLQQVMSMRMKPVTYEVTNLTHNAENINFRDNHVFITNTFLERRLSMIAESINHCWFPNEVNSMYYMGNMSICARIVNIPFRFLPSTMTWDSIYVSCEKLVITYERMEDLSRFVDLENGIYISSEVSDFRDYIFQLPIVVSDPNDIHIF